MSLIYIYIQPWLDGNALDLGHSRLQDGHPLLIARSTTKVVLEVPYKPQGIGGNGGKIEKKFILPT